MKFKGFYINRHDDTIKGIFTHYKQWNYNPDKVNFIDSQTGGQVDLTPSTCREFQIENFDTYISYKGTRLKNPIVLSAVSTYDNTDIYDSINTFLRQIAVTEQYKFYVYKDHLRINLYYSGNHTVLTELLQKASVINNAFWESMTYKKQLQELFPDENIREQIDNLHYSEESLVAFVNTRSGGRTLSKKAKNSNNGFFILAGVSLNSFEFTFSDRNMYFTSKYYPSKTIPIATIGYIISIGRNFNRIFFLPQLKVFSFRHSATAVYNDSYPTFTNTFQSSPVISLGFHFGCNIINKPNLKVSIAPGCGVSLLAHNRQTEKIMYSAANSRTFVTVMDHTTSLIDLQGMVLIRKKYIIWSSYNFPTPVANYATSSGRLTSVQLGMGYKF